MKTVYTIDNGNGHPHVGIFKGSTPDRVISLKQFLNEDIESSYQAIMASVGPKVNFPKDFNLLDIKTLRSVDSFLDMPVNYTETLGLDRVCNAYYVYKNILKSDKKILVIDAGTFATFDLITKNGFAGGFILPGSRVFLESYTKGSNLPHLEKLDIKKDIALPTSTESAIQKGYNLYMLGILKTFIEKFSPDQIILTGGDAKSLESIIDLPYNLEPHLIHLALFDIAGRYS